MILSVNLNQHSYQIKVQRNSLALCGAWVKSIWQEKKVALVTDSTVNQIYAQKVKESLNDQGFSTTVMMVPSGEASKSLEMAELLYSKLTQNNFTKNDGIIALGGGVVGDLAGFVAATYMRGLHFLQIPTSLLAQVDSSIGGKTAVNMAVAKNLIGSFYQPDGVLIDPDVLDTLPQSRLKEGVAEIIKAAAIADTHLWQLLDRLKNLDELKRCAEEVIVPALKVKKQVVEEDEFDQNQRLILNFGHTIGHAIEKNAGFDTISHGESIAIGMVKITEHAEEIGLTAKTTTRKLQQMLSKFDLPLTFADFDAVQIKEAIIHDKKVRNDQLNIILLEKIGEAKIVPIRLDTIAEYL
ncbi:3-dehydroquinate synthase [Tetragenococcus solitarius]|uniref:3-dehydroquinate synthase n=1 Tax=Tetragenococcus solitarius TaxID=71453 RepID=A0ABN3Y3S5_9ENTE